MSDLHDHGPYVGSASGDVLAPPRPPVAGPPSAGASPRPEPRRPARRRGWLSAAAVGAIVGSTVSAGVLVGMDPDDSAGAPAPAPASSTATDPDDAVVADTGAGAVGGTLVQQVLAQVEPATVAITTSGSVQGPFGRSQASGAGTGMVLEADGLIVTNAHVVSGASAIEVRFADGTTAAATLVGTDVGNDVAVIQAEGVTDHPTVTLADDAELEVGELVVAIGNALGLDGGPTVTQGILSAIDRDIQTTDAQLTGLIQTDAAINPGNSGGPLVDAEGHVLGMNTAVAGQAQNIGFAVSADVVRASVAEIQAGGGDEGQAGVVAGGAYLGVQVADAPGGGAQLVAVEPGAPAAEAGLEAGDVVRSIDGEAVADGSALVAAVRDREPGDEVTFGVTGQGGQRTVEVELGER